MYLKNQKHRWEARKAMQTVETILLKRRNRKQTGKLKKQRERIRIREAENRILKANARRTARELETVKESLTTAYCPFCEEHNLFAWDPGWGVTSFCPKCGARVMICELCEKYDHGCDYDQRTDTCSEM